MDALTQLAHRIRASGALIGTSLLDPPWSLQLDERPSLTVVAPLRGRAWLHTQDGPPVLLEERDLALVRGPEPFTVASDPDPAAPPRFTYRADGGVADDAGRLLPDEDVTLALRTCGQRLDAENALISGSFRAIGRLTRRLLDALPRRILVPRPQQHRVPMELLEAELRRDEPGQQAVLDRVLDLVLIGALRDAAMGQEDAAALPGWLSATGDPVIGPALEAIHGDPGRAHSVESLAAASGVSRAAFARRFSAALGQAPIAYLTQWRLCLAADLLVEEEATLESIAGRVGYSSAFALSTAFHREFAVRPARYRARESAAIQ